jgi:hypothetical protein
MGKKGRRSRSRKTRGDASSGAPAGEPVASAQLERPSAPTSIASPEPVASPAPVASAESVATVEPVASVEAASPDPSECTPPPVVVDPPGLEAAPPRPSIPSASDLDAPFFAQAPAEAWIAHELELRDPRSMRKMTAGVARRRAHLARYVVGVVGVAIAVCLVALVKLAVPASDDASARPAARMAMPATQAPPAQDIPPAQAVVPAEGEDAVDGG